MASLKNWTPAAALLCVALSACGPRQEKGAGSPATSPEAGFYHTIDAAALNAVVPVAAPEGCRGLQYATTITEPGRYCLTHNIVITQPNQAGIIIAANNVQLDLNGRTIASVAPETTGSGIRADGFTNIVVRNGAVSGFLAGVMLNDAANATVEDLDLTGNQWRGVRTTGGTATIRGNTIRRLPGHRPYADSPPAAIEVRASRCTVENNTFGSVRPLRQTDNVGIVASGGCSPGANTNEGFPEGFCLPLNAAGTITQPGTYCLANDITAPAGQDAISIVASDVILDLAGHTIQGPGAGTLGAGVRADGRTNVAVRNGAISGFLAGVRLENVNNARVEGLNLSENAWRGARVTGTSAVVTGNTVRNLPGHAPYRDSPPVALDVQSDVCTIENNTYGGLPAASANIGISPKAGAAGCVVGTNTNEDRRR